LKLGIVGAGPAGSLLAYRMALAGASVSLFDHSHPREKPCGGGITGRAIALLPPAPAADPLPARRVDRLQFDSGAGDRVEVELQRPIAVAARSELDAWLLRRAVDAGARHVPERVVSLGAEARLRTAAGREVSFYVVVGADGASSLVRRTFLRPTPPERLCVAAGWLAPGTSPLVVRFTPGLPGYLWLFPRPDHVGVGICAPLGCVPTRALLARLEAEVAAGYPGVARKGGGRYAHTIPSPSSDPESLREIAGRRWALVGDAAALADPLTGEGIYHALRSALVLAETLGADGSPAGYPERVERELGGELLRAAALRARFFAPGFPRRMVRYSARSRAIRAVLRDLVLGDQGYADLERRLLRAAPAFLWQLAASALGSTRGASPDCS
jgi:flavin-dependent dehydrogenase